MDGADELERVKALYPIVGDSQTTWHVLLHCGHEYVTTRPRNAPRLQTYICSKCKGV